MSSTIEQTKEAILKHGGRASKHQIARELKISLDYAGLICGELKRKGEIAFLDGFYVRKKPTIPLKRVGRRPKRLKGEKKTKKPRAEKRTPHPLSSVLESASHWHGL